MCLVGGIAFAVYSNTLFNGFVDDDETQVLRNPWIKDVRFIPDMFSKNVWSFWRGSGFSNYYRPLMHVTYLVNYHLFGFQAWGFHLVNVLFHVANTILVFLLTARVTGVDHASGIRADDTVTTPLLFVPFIAALLFATHPVHTEAVAWIAAIPELSFTLLYLLSFYLHVASGRGPGNRVLPSAAFFLLALLCKETALTLPVLLVVYDVALGKKNGTRAAHLSRYAPYLVVAAVYLTTRYHVLFETLVPAARLYDLTSYQLIINVFPLFSDYVEKLFMPIHLCFWHSFHPISSLLTPEGALGLVVGTVFLAAAVLSWTKHRVSFLCLWLFAISLSPAFYINAIGGKPFAERYLYLPSVGFVILAALLLSRVATMKRMRIAAVAIVVATAGLYSIGTVSRNSVWKRGFDLYSDTVSKSPDAPIPRYNLATTLFNQGQVDEAMAQYWILVTDNPNNVQARSALASLLLAEGYPDEAIGHLNIALSLAPDSLEARNNLGIALRKRGQVEEAIGQFRTALTIDPQFADAHFSLGGVLADIGQMKEATEHYRAAVRLRPESDYYRNILGIECAKQGLVDEAIKQFQEAVRLVPSEPAYRSNLDRALALKQSGTVSPEDTR